MTENQFQEATASLLHRLGWWFWHTPNEQHKKGVAIRGKKRGVLAGVPDWIGCEPWRKDGQTGTMIAIELKVGKGRLSETQKRFLRRAESAGWLCAVCWTMDEFTNVLRYVRPRNGRRRWTT